MDSTLIQIFAFSILVAAVIGLIRFNRIDQAYFPFVLLLWLGLTNEIINFIVIRNGYSNAINSNIYCLLESLLIAWLFKRWELFSRPVVFYIIATVFLVAWVIIVFFIFSIGEFNSYFNIIYAFTIVLMSIHKINQLIVNEHQKILKNPKFIICIGFIAFFMYLVLVEIFWLYGLNASKTFRLQIYRIMSYINLTVNLLFAIALLCIPRKREYTLLS